MIVRRVVRHAACDVCGTVHCARPVFQDCGDDVDDDDDDRHSDSEIEVESLQPVASGAGASGRAAATRKLLADPGTRARIMQALPDLEQQLPGLIVTSLWCVFGWFCCACLVDWLVV